MKKQNIVSVFLAGAMLLQVTSVAFAQYDDGFVGSGNYYSTGTTYPSYDTGTTYPTYDTGTTYPTYNTGTTYPTYNTGTTYPTYDTGTTYPTYSTSDVTYPTYDTGTVYSTYNTGVATYPTVYGSTGYGYPATYGYTTSYGYPSTVGTYGYVNNNYTNNNNNTSCPSGSTLVNGTCQITSVSCPSGSTNINGVCTITTTSCPSGSTLINGVCTVTTTNTNYTCWNGTVVAYASLCPVNYNTNYNGSNYYGNTTYYNNQPLVRYPTVTPLPTVKFNNVVTSVVTQITNTSARCNGIGLIANGSPSTGWFEYGETANLGRTTASASIGRNATAPFSNVLAGLKPTTRYYCRAVMQNEFGIVKGEIVSFVTKSKVTTYVQPVTTVKKVVTKKVVEVVKQTKITCTDGTSVWVKNESPKTSSSASPATILNQGDKLVTLQIEKGEEKMSANSPVSYKIVYRNLSDSRLTGVVVKVVIPSEVALSLATAGSYDEATHVLTLNQDTLDAHAEGIIAISGKIKEDAPVGKSIVTTAYVVYTVPGTSVQDEVTAYVVGSITPTTSMSGTDTGAKKVIGSGNSERGFMPSNLVEWLALIAIIFIIFILGRSIYLSYQEDEKDGH